jgi:uncharacterized tellurite resistance protein B-like protein
MNSKHKTRKLLKILFGVAWLDGTIQPEERQYLHKMAQAHSLSEDSEIRPLLSETKPIVAEDCYSWLREYLGENPSQNDFQELLESLSALIYSDGIVDIKEAQLLNYLEELETEGVHPTSSLDKLLRIIQELYRKAIS